MEPLYKAIENQVYDNDLFKQYEHNLNLDIIEYIYRNNYFDYLKYILKFVVDDYNHINHYLLTKPNFLEFKDILIESTQLFEHIIWAWLDIHKIPECNISFILENQENFTNKLGQNDIYYLALKINKTENLQLNPYLSVQKIFEFYIINENIEILDEWIQKYPMFSLLRAFMTSIKYKKEQSQEWIINHFELNKLKEEDLLDIFDIIMKYKNVKLFKWYVNHFIYFTSYEYLIQKTIRHQVLEMIQHLYYTNSELFLNYLNVNDLSLHYTYDIYVFINEIYPIVLNSKLFWNILENTKDKISFLQSMESNYDLLMSIESEQFHHINSLLIIQHLENAYKLFIDKNIERLIYHSIIHNQLDMIQWYFTKYPNIDIEKILSNNSYIACIYSKPVLLELEKRMNLYIHQYDTIMTWNCKMGEDEIIEYLVEKFPNRYKLKITNYYYNFVLNRFQKNYHLDIQIIQNIIHNKESIECLICYEMKKNNIYKTNCNHYYCMECYENWYTQNEKHECAYCRQSVYAIDKLMEKL